MYHPQKVGFVTVPSTKVIFRHRIAFAQDLEKILTFQKNVQECKHIPSFSVTTVCEQPLHAV